jgi:ribose transport system permease protein
LLLRFESLLRSERNRRFLRGKWSLLVSQSIPLQLALLIFVFTSVLYAFLFHLSQGRLPGNFEITSTVNNTLPLALAAVGQTIVVLTRGIDLSVGGMIDLANSLAAVTIHPSPGSMLVWSVAVLLLGGAGGLVNGLLVGVGRLQPILVTLATLAIFQGVAIRVLPEPGGAIPPAYTQILANPNAPTSLLFVLLLILAWWIFRRTPLGIAIYAVGTDEHAARANGLNVLLTKVAAYTLGGVMSAAAGLFLAATTTAGDATTGNGFTLTSIAAVVLGGVNLFGGRGSAIGSIAGAFVLTLVVNVLFFAHIDPLYQSFFQGLFLIFAVVISALLGRYVRRTP